MAALAWTKQQINDNTATQNQERTTNVFPWVCRHILMLSTSTNLRPAYSKRDLAAYKSCVTLETKVLLFCTSQKCFSSLLIWRGFRHFEGWTQLASWQPSFCEHSSLTSSALEALLGAIHAELPGITPSLVFPQVVVHPTFKKDRKWKSLKAKISQGC